MIVSGLAETEGDQDLASFLNRTLLPARFSVAYANRLGQKRSDQSPRLCKLDFEVEIYCEVVLSHARNLKGLSNSPVSGLHIRPALTPVQLERKRQFDDYMWGSFCTVSSGRFLVSVRYLFDGTAYLWHFARREKIEPMPTSRLRATRTSLSDCEVPRFSSEASPASLSQPATGQDVSFLSPI